jgi:hypothetical protein
MHTGFWWGNLSERPLGRPRHKWEDNTSIKVDLQEEGWQGMDWIDLAQDRNRWHALVNMVMNLPPETAGNFLTMGKPVSFSRRTLLHGVSISNCTLKFHCFTVHFSSLSIMIQQMHLYIIKH